MSDLYDIIIIGGGINGCSLARHAAEHGFQTALLEKDDFGAGVTSRSTRLIHGGLRYLESFQFGVVKESLQDRRAWLDEFPGIVGTQAFVIPIYQGDSRPPWYVLPLAGLEYMQALAQTASFLLHQDSGSSLSFPVRFRTLLIAVIDKPAFISE